MGSSTPSSSPDPARFERLLGAARGLSRSLELDEVLAAALEATLALLGGERAMVGFRELKSVGDKVKVNTIHRYRTAAGIEDHDDAERHEAFAVTNAVLESGEAHGVVPQGPEGLGHACLCVPLHSQEKPSGALFVSRPGQSFTEAEDTLLRELAALVSQAVANAAAHAGAVERMVHQERLNRVFLSISHHLDLEKVQEMVLQLTVELTKAERAFVLLWQGSELVFAAGRDRLSALTEESARDLSRTACQKVLDTKKGVFIFDTRDDAEFASRHSVVDRQLKSILAVPLIGSSGLIGVLYVDSRSELPAALEQDLLVLTAIASQACILIENAQLLRQATVDGLTGLYIRSYIMNRLEEETRRTVRYGGTFSLVVIDVDRFKVLNDTYGHQTGDAALQMVAHQVARGLRHGIDLCGRYGGEELLVLLPATDAAGAMVAAERMRERVAEARLVGPGGEAIAVTVSIGVATLPGHASSGLELFACADQALYTSKREGRNRTTLFTPALAARES